MSEREGAGEQAELVHRRVTVHGLVQGVFFRDSARREALRLGVHGSIRNASDGTVVAHVEGTGASVEAMLAWLRRGPSRAHVSRIDFVREAPTGVRGFDIE